MGLSNLDADDRFLQLLQRQLVLAGQRRLDERHRLFEDDFGLLDLCDYLVIRRSNKEDLDIVVTNELLDGKSGGGWCGREGTGNFLDL